MTALKVFDVVVLGGGPAGATAAITLARDGLTVAVIERTQFDGTRIGETMSPAILRPLSKLGLLEQFRQAGHHAAPGFVVVWGDDEAHERDHIFSPYGQGWHLDRTRFDAMLVEAAANAGARVFQRSSVVTCERDGRGAWQLHVTVGGATLDLTANFVIDATGRSAWLAHRQGAQRQTFDRLVALIAYVSPSRCTDPRTVIEACPEGWWYSAQLPDHRLIFAFFTDHDLFPRDAEEMKRFWDECLQRTNVVKQPVEHKYELQNIRCVSANSSRLTRVAGPGWVALGDAAQSHDPLSGQGVIRALEAGMNATSIVERLTGGEDTAIDFLTSAANQIFSQYLISRANHYSRETRWPESQFWKRRHYRQPQAP